jgi:hypothetical protein
MQIEISKETVSQFLKPAEIDKLIVDAEKDSKFKKNKGRFEIYYGMMIGGMPLDVSKMSKDEYLKAERKKYGVSSILYTDGKRNASKSVKIDLNATPIKEIDDIIVDAYNLQYNTTVLEKTRLKFFEKVLKKLNKKSNLFEKNRSNFKMPGVMNGLQHMQMLQQQMQLEDATIPSLEEIAQAEPEIYNEYLEKVKSGLVVLFSPEHEEADKYGFSVFKVKGAYRYLGKKDEKLGTVFSLEALNENARKSNLDSYVLRDGRLDWYYGQNTDIIEKMLNAKPGTEFVGYNKAKAYRLSEEEVTDIVTKKIYETDVFF